MFHSFSTYLLQNYKLRLIERDLYIPAKHLTLSGCRTAYPTLEVAKQAVQPMITGNEDDIESFDPNEVMAKAYMAKKPEDDPKVPSKSRGGTKVFSGPRSQKTLGGPLAFLGLQKTTTGDSDVDIPEKDDENSRENKIIEDKSVDGWSTEPNSKNVEKETDERMAEKKIIIEDKSVDGWSVETNSKNVEKEATKETEKKKDDTSSDEKEATKETEKKKDETSSDEGCTKETNSKNDEKETTNETEKKKDDTSTDDGREETEQDDKNTGNDKDDDMET